MSPDSQPGEPIEQHPTDDSAIRQEPPGASLWSRVRALPWPSRTALANRSLLSSLYLVLSGSITVVLLGSSGVGGGSLATFTNRQVTTGNYFYADYLGAPTLDDPTLNGAQIDLSWTAAGQSYNYASFAVDVSLDGSTFTETGTTPQGTTTFSYTWTSTGTHFFQVRAKAGTYWESASNVKQITVP